MARIGPILRGGGVLKTIGLLEGGHQEGTTVLTSVKEIPAGGPLSKRKSILIQNQDGSNNVWISMTPPVNLHDTGVYEWIPSGNGTDEWYVRLKAGGGTPGLTEAKDVYTSIVAGADKAGTETAATAGTVGSLTLGKWDWGTNEPSALGYSTVYVCTDGTTPFEYFNVILAYYRRPAIAGSLVGFRLAAGQSKEFFLSGNTRIFAIADGSSLVSTLEFI